MLESIRIEVSGNAEALQPTVDKLKEIGVVDKKNADQFKANNIEFEVASKKRQKLLDEEKADLIELQKLKKLAYSPEEIQQYERSIKSTQERIRLLSAETVGMQKSMAGVVTQTNALGESVKKSYGFLRLAANIIPGLGISGLILFGYEALASIIETVTGSFEENTEAVLYNKEALDELTESHAKLQAMLQQTIQEELVLKGKLSDTDVKRFKAQEDYIKREKEINNTKLRMIKELADTYQMSAEDFKQYSEKIIYFGKISSSEAKKIIDDLKLGENEGLARDLDTRLAVMDQYYDKIQALAIMSASEQRDNEIMVNEQTSLINAQGYDKDVKEKKKHIKKKKDVEDEWWKWYLKMWEKNFNELLHAYKKDADEFIKQNERKFQDAVKRSEDNIALVIEDMQIEASMTKDRIDDENAAFQERLNNRKKVFGEDNKETKESLAHQEMLVKQHNYNLAKIQEEADKEKDKKRKEDTKKTIGELKQVMNFAFDVIEAMHKANIEAIDRQQDLQKDAVEVQRRQAELGRDNTLAFEEKRAADLEKQRMQEQKKLIKLKELETFLNSVASFSKDDPQSAVAKALAQLAIIKGYEATFMEEGGILGHESNSKSWLGRKHKGGGDILVHAQTGEGFFSRKEIASMGGEQAFLNFKNMLGNNQLPPIPMTGVMFQGFDTKRLEDRLENIEKTIKDKPEWQIDWVSKGDMDYRREVELVKGVRKEVLVELKRRRI